MRLLIDSLIAMMLVVIFAGVILHHRQKQRQGQQHQAVHRSLAQLHEVIVYQAALGGQAGDRWDYPRVLSPDWFPEGLPTNPIVPGRHPWVDVAPVGDTQDHPPDPVLTHDSQAGFWYNPNRGLVRARVQPQFTERGTLALYNRLNGTMLLSLPQSGNVARQPQPHPLLEKLTDAEGSAGSADAPATGLPSPAGVH